ncbi:hypothetical protein Sjap_010500 [Stephania japonica]|uniref:Xaa-Pro dipeptidase n=1 Tax=Stephania japonica TaxID=461633 RepID=A0AAP0P483_9MAGN
MASHGPPEIAMELHALSRAKLVHSFRQRLKASSLPLFGFVFLQGGEEHTRYCSDHVMLFRQESFFAYLFGVREPGFYGAIDVSTGKSILFAPKLSEDYAVWSGKIKPLSSFKERYMVSAVHYTDEIPGILKSQYRGPGKPLLYLLSGLNSDSNKYSIPASFEGNEAFEKDLTSLHPILTESRIFKSELELGLIKYANDISSAAHIEALFHRSAIIHYGHAAAPNDRTLVDGDMALMDMGAEYHFYASDVACSFPVNGKFSDDQSLVYNAVLKAHNAVLSEIKPGVSWIDMHKLAEKHILESLAKGGILVGEVDAMMDARLGAVFMPHGLGHFLGIDAHDPGGYPQGIERPTEPGLKALRTTRELKEGMLTEDWKLANLPKLVVLNMKSLKIDSKSLSELALELCVLTVSPGCYFNEILLNKATEDPTLSAFINNSAISRFMRFGGVRIESDVHVSSDGCENFTDLPRETWEIEVVMAGASWPLNNETILKYKKEKSSSTTALTPTTAEQNVSSTSEEAPPAVAPAQEMPASTSDATLTSID